MNTQNPTPGHQYLLASLLVHLRDSFGHTILKAVYEGFQNPEAHGRHEPDFVTRDPKGLLHLGEAKVGDDIFSQITREQICDFSNRVMFGTNFEVPLHIIVYKIDLQNLYSVLDNLSLREQVGKKIQVWIL